MRATFVIKKIKQINNHPVAENSPNLVTLSGRVEEEKNSCNP
jgi:hypothetical protein